MFRELEHSAHGPGAVNVRFMRLSATAGQGFFPSPARASCSWRPGFGLALPSMQSCSHAVVQSCIRCPVALASSCASRRMNSRRRVFFSFKFTKETDKRCQICGIRQGGDRVRTAFWAREQFRLATSNTIKTCKFFPELRPWSNSNASANS